MAYAAVKLYLLYVVGCRRYRMRRRWAGRGNGRWEEAAFAGEVKSLTLISATTWPLPHSIARAEVEVQVSGFNLIIIIR